MPNVPRSDMEGQVSTDLGRVALCPRGVYLVGQIYDRLDLVRYGGAGWICLKDGTESVPEEGESWTLYVDGGAPGEPGEAGNGIKSIDLTSGDHSPGTTDQYTVTMTDGTDYTIPVYNGADGGGAGDMMAGVYDPQKKREDIFAYVDEAVKNVKIEMDDTPTEGSQNAVSSAGVYDALEDKQDKLTGSSGQFFQVSADGAIRAVNIEPGDNIQIAQVGDTIKISSAGGGASSNPNLLDNWYFIGGGSQQGGGQFPINQRGKTEYTTIGYTVDRWKLYSSDSTLSLRENGVKITSNLNNRIDTNAVFQILNEALVELLREKQITVSFVVNNFLGDAWLLYVRCGGDYPEGELVGGYTKRIDETGLIYITYTIPQNAKSIRIGIMQRGSSAGDNISIQAAKLELGPVQTLAHKEGDTWILNDPPPNYALELAKCQRYQAVLSAASPSNSSRFFAMGIFSGEYAQFFFTEFNFRASPEVIVEGNFLVTQTFTGAKSYGATYMNKYYVSVNGCVLRFSVGEGHPYTAGDALALRADADQTTKIIFDANL